MKTDYSITRPTLLIDETKCRANIRQMTERAKRHGLIFRPHFKTPQSIEIGEWFRAEGVKQITVSSLEMAAYFAKGGWRDITVAFPVNILEINLINQLATDIQLNLLVESPNTVGRLNKELKTDVKVFIKINLGNHRTGIDPNHNELIDQTVSAIEKSQLMTFAGFLGHAGQSYKARGLNQIRAVHHSSMPLLDQLKAKYQAQYPDLMTSYGDTPTCSHMEDFGTIDEIRPGNFVFYDIMQQAIGSCQYHQIGVAMACPIVAIHPLRNEMVIYGGGVHFSKEHLINEEGTKTFGQLVVSQEKGWGDVIPGAYLKALSQEHGILRLPYELIPHYKVGDIVRILPVHSCMTANLMKTYVNLDGQQIKMMETANSD